ncbi:MAG: hypothetical protein JO205_06075 [Pseudolabrys sp.]|nr:hypothetical protein [Pseudolabrys sp.]
MSLPSFITIVASPRPHVGKTLIARMLADYHLSGERKVQAFDLNARDAALTAFQPRHAHLSDIEDIKGQMALFDALVAEDDIYKVVDLGHEAFEKFFLIAQDIRFADEARRRGLAPVILYVASPDAASVEAYAALVRLFPVAVIVPVHNEILGPAQHRDKFPPHGKGAQLLHLPLLAPGLRRTIEQRPFSFIETAGSAGPEIPLDVSIELQRWMRKLFLEFRELELRVLMADLTSSIQR